MTGYQNPILAWVFGIGALAFLLYAAITWIAGLRGWRDKRKTLPQPESVPPPKVVLKGNNFTDGDAVVHVVGETPSVLLENNKITRNKVGVLIEDKGNKKV